MGRSYKDHTGLRYGHLTVLGIEEKAERGILWLCECDCGVRKTVLSTSLSSGNVKSCGCLTGADPILRKGTGKGKIYTIEGLHARAQRSGKVLPKVDKKIGWQGKSSLVV